MPAHSEIPNVVKEDHSCCRAGIDGFAEERADDDFRPTRFTYHSGAEVIEFTLKALYPVGQVSCPEIRSTGNDDTRRLPFGVGVNYFNPALLHHEFYRNSSANVKLVARCILREEKFSAGEKNKSRWLHAKVSSGIAGCWWYQSENKYCLTLFKGVA
jgi:hypothetical protein